jgi:hypothetical protein
MSTSYLSTEDAALRLMYVLKRSKKNSLRLDLDTYKIIAGDDSSGDYYRDRLAEIEEWLYGFYFVLRVFVLRVDKEDSEICFVLTNTKPKGFKIPQKDVLAILTNTTQDDIIKALGLDEEGEDR